MAHGGRMVGWSNVADPGRPNLAVHWLTVHDPIGDENGIPRGGQKYDRISEETIEVCKVIDRSSAGWITVNDEITEPTPCHRAP